MYCEEGSLKRNQFAENIRQEQRERKRKQIRDKYAELMTHDYEAYHEQVFKAMRTDCIAHKYSLKSVQPALEYLLSKNIRLGLTQDINLKFLEEVTCLMSAQLPIQEQLVLQQTIKKKLLELIELEILASPKDDRGNLLPTQEYASMPVLSNCFDGLLGLISRCRCYSDLWVPISHLRNIQFKEYSFVYLYDYLQDHISELSEDELRAVINSLQGFFEDCPRERHKFIIIIDLLFATYHITPFDAMKLLDPVLDCLQGTQLNSMVEFIAEDTRLVQNVTAYLDKSEKKEYRSNFDLAAKVGDFIARLYAADDIKVCEKVYMKNVMILSLIRSWLPVQPISIPMLEHCSNGTLMHSNHKCTSHLIFALTNIVVTDDEFLESMLTKSDIYRCLIYMYKMVPISVREEIAVFVHNMTYKCQVGGLRVMLECKLPETIAEMLKEDNSIILNKSLMTLNLLGKALADEDMSHMSPFLYSRKMLKIKLDSLGALKHIESLVHSPEQEISNAAVKVLENLK